jgi:hypothetical protein
MFAHSRLLVLPLTVALTACLAEDPDRWTETPVEGQTEFISAEPGNENNGGYAGSGGAGGADAGAMASADGGGGDDPQAAPGAPGGRQAEVEEAEIFRLDNDRLYTLNTYKGLLIYDLKDPTQPKRVSRLPIYGYPIEMFFKDDVVYALVKDALYLTQEKSALTFQRYNVSQLIAIDVSDITKPQIIQRYDIDGLLREGVSRKVEDSLYVVSYQPTYYYSGWRRQSNASEERAYVYSYDISDPKAIAPIDELELFKGGSINQSNTDGSTTRKTFSTLGISATSNALMVTENWRIYEYNNQNWGCGSYKNYSEAKISIVDISDPSGQIRIHTSFTMPGQLTDQFKQTYIYDADTGKGTYLGIFARNDWISCERVQQNYLVTVDITDGENPTPLDGVKFGKPNETVRGSVFDLKRKVAFAITARNMDPLYAIDISDVSKLKIRSEIDGLSGEMSVFRFIGDRKFLLAVGRDNSDSCNGFGTGWSSTKMAASIIDVQDLDNIRLVQRSCVAVNSGRWQSSSITWNQDQAHKMLGMYSEEGLNLLAVPVTFYESMEGENNWNWHWYEQRSAVGLMKWDLDAYDPSKDHLGQNVFTNLGSALHPAGEVKRTVFYRHSTTDQRLMLTLSETHMAITDMSDLDKPVSLSVTEIAPFVKAVYQFGDYLVEQTTPSNSYYGKSSWTKFRIKAANSSQLVDNRPVLASFTVGSIQSVVMHGDQLVLFHHTTGDYYYDYSSGSTQVSVYDLSDPLKPQAAGTLTLPFNDYGYYGYYCGVGNGRFGLSNTSHDWNSVNGALVKLRIQGDYDYGSQKYTYTNTLLSIAMGPGSTPTLQETPLPSAEGGSYLGVVVDEIDPSLFYLNHRKLVGTKQINDHNFNLYKYFAQPYRYANGALLPETPINIPGRLMRTYLDVGSSTRMMLTSDYAYELREDMKETEWTKYYSSYYFYHHYERLHLLRQVPNSALAELRGSETFKNWDVGDLLLLDNKLIMSGRYSYQYYEDQGIPYEYQNTQLRLFDLSGQKLGTPFTSELGAPYIQLMGGHANRLLIRISNEGVLVLDVTDLTKPFGLSFAQSFGYSTHTVFTADRAYVAAGHYGLLEIPLAEPSLAIQ